MLVNKFEAMAGAFVEVDGVKYFAILNSKAETMEEHAKFFEIHDDGSTMLEAKFSKEKHIELIRKTSELSLEFILGKLGEHECTNCGECEQEEKTN